MTGVARKRSLVPYACVDVDLPRHAKIVTLSDPPAGLGIWLALTTYAREQLTDGRVPRAYAESLFGGGRRIRGLLGEMSEARFYDEPLLEKTKTDYVVVKYSPRNQTKADVEEGRKQARDRQRSRRCSSVTTGDVTRDNRVSHAVVPVSASISSDLSSSLEGVQGEPASGTHVVAPRRDPTTEPFVGDAWARGVADVRGGAPVAIRGAELAGVADIAVAARLPWSELLEWVTADARSYAKSEAGAVNGFRYRDWVRGGRKSPSGQPHGTGVVGRPREMIQLPPRPARKTAQGAS